MSVSQDSYTQLGHRHGPPDGGRLCAPVKSINMALLTEGELALSSIDSERQNNKTNARPTELLITPVGTLLLEKLRHRLKSMLRRLQSRHKQTRAKAAADHADAI